MRISLPVGLSSARSVVARLRFVTCARVSGPYLPAADAGAHLVEKRRVNDGHVDRAEQRRWQGERVVEIILDVVVVRHGTEPRIALEQSRADVVLPVGRHVVSRRYVARGRT
jgi:hypothetical protein